MQNYPTTADNSLGNGVPEGKTPPPLPHPEVVPAVPPAEIVTPPIAPVVVAVPEVAQTQTAEMLNPPTVQLQTGSPVAPVTETVQTQTIQLQPKASPIERANDLAIESTPIATPEQAADHSGSPNQLEAVVGSGAD